MINYAIWGYAPVWSILIHFRRSIGMAGMGSWKLHAAVSSDVVELNYCSGMELCPSPRHTIKRQPLCWHSIAGNFEGKLCVLCRIMQDQYFASTGCATQNWDFKYFDWTIISRYCMSKPSHPGECQNSWQMFTLRIWYEHVWTINWSWRIPTSNFNLQHQRPPRTRAPTWNGASVFTTKERWLGRVEMGGINVRAATPFTQLQKPSRT